MVNLDLILYFSFIHTSSFTFLYLKQVYSGILVLESLGLGANSTSRLRGPGEFAPLPLPSQIHTCWTQGMVKGWAGKYYLYSPKYSWNFKM